MLSLILDEMLSPEVARQINGKRGDVLVTSVHHWREGEYKAQRDEAILAVSAKEGLTLVTYDQKTVLPVLVRWTQEVRDHSGVVFVDDRTIASNEIGLLVLALIDLWDESHTYDWTNRVGSLRKAPRWSE